jgi:hemoglobin-like flavoprotein
MRSTLTRRECELVQASFAEIEPISNKVATLFYARLFQLNPLLRSLFKSDMEQQGLKFMETLAVAVVGLEDLDAIAPLVQALGRSHAAYGVQERDYETAREALMWALGEALGPAFESELRDAWRAAFEALSGAMRTY